MDYSKTVNLLQTSFPMKADLPTREPLMLSHWEDSNLYGKIQEKTKNRPIFLLHDGPPYANGTIHIGHALNKILKDFVVKYKNLAGFHSPYKPGWDCHGLPIEHQLFKELGKSKHQVSRTELREKATAYALRFVDLQRKDFKRLGVLGDWNHPYLTLSKEYEASIVKTFFELKEKGFITKGLKPGYWCVYDETALAEAEVEYADKKSDSVFVRFLLSGGGLPKEWDSLKGKNVFILIWTTTPWTLPANRGLAFHPDEKYGVLKKGDDYYIVAEKLKQSVAQKIEASVVDQIVEISGRNFERFVAKNPLNQENSLVINANYVTMEDGTGIVHIAAGHGVEDYAAGLKYNLEVLSPVGERGEFDEQVRPVELKGKHVLKDANKAVMDILSRGEDLLFHQVHKHSYPHCWRCKNPIVFRATEQWFLEVSPTFRQKLLDGIDSVRWEPAFGIHRIKGMVEQRPDWCLSRQRHWGAPIPVFYCADKKCRTIYWNKDFNAKLVALIRSEGTNVYYDNTENALFQKMGISAKCEKCAGTSFQKEMDILDVWFDSGVSWAAVVEEEFGNLKPDQIMYLEGSDQHRGWFQTSLIPSVALRNKPPYQIVLTHGFIMDGKGHKMSKSLGNVVSPQEVIEKFGADVLRLWVAMSDYREDVRVSQDIIKHMVDVYRRFRNTFRFFLQNTADFNVSQHKVSFEKLEEIDQWVLTHFEEVKTKVQKAYDQYEFHVVLSELNRFAAVELSGFYLDAHKDRLYCESPNSPLRRSAQSALFELARGLCVLTAPLLSFTAEEAYLELRKTCAPHLPESVFLDSFRELLSVSMNSHLLEKWNKILEMRSLVNDELDRRRKEGVLKSAQEAEVHINKTKLEERFLSLFENETETWPFLLQMSEVFINGKNPDTPTVLIQSTKNLKCERCWRHRSDVGKSKEHSQLCARCVNVVSSLPV